MSLPLRRLAAAGASLGGAGMCYEAHRYRATFHLTGVVPGQEETSHFSEPPPSWLYARARDAVIAAGSAGCAFITQVLNTTDVRNVHHFRRAHAARSERPVLTVCNHQSCLDDPCLLPLLLADSGVVLDGASMRWGIGKEALCFSSDLASAFFSAAKILPVRRGGGLEQPGLAVLARKATPGQWLHIYPEGRVWQCHPLGGGVAQWDGTPYNHKKAIAGHRPYLRWGVGKVVAEAPASPVIVPFYHTGLADVLPQDLGSDRVLSFLPGVGNQIRVEVGEPFDCDDLVAAHSAELALLEKKGQADAAAVQRAKHHLYAAITERVQAKLVALQELVRADLGLADTDYGCMQAGGKRVHRPMTPTE